MDFAVIDLVLPRLDGWQTFLRIKSRSPGVRTILTTGFVDEGQRERMLAAGVNAVLRKPYSVEDLLAALMTVTQRESVA